MGSKRKAVLKINAGISSVQSFYYLGQSTLFGFLTVLLHSRGFSNSQVGLITALSSLLSVFLQPLLGGLTDRKDIPTKHIIVASLGVALTGSLLLSFVPAFSVLVMMLFFIIMGGARLSVMSFLNALTMQLKNIGIPVNFGIARGLGSLFFALGGIGIGYLVNLAGPEVILPAHSIITFITIVIVITMKRVDKLRIDFNSTPELFDESHHTAQPLLKILTGNQTLIWILLAITITFLSSGTLEVFLINILENVGGDSVDLGTALFIMAGAEIPTMFLFSQIIKRFKSSALLRISIIAFLAKSILLLLAVNPTMVVLTHLVYILANGLFVPASVYFINDLVRKNERTRGQALATAATVGGSVIGNALGGLVIDYFGVVAMMIMCLIFAVISVIIINLALYKHNKDQFTSIRYKAS